MSTKAFNALVKLVDDHGSETWENLAVMLDKAVGVKVHRTCVASAMRKIGVRTFKERYKSLLSDKHRASRMAFAAKHKNDEADMEVHVDEKYFEIASARRTEKRRKGKTPKAKRFQSKRFQPKAFFLTAAAKPNKTRGFDGKIGCWRVGVLKTALRSSKNHAKGARYLVDCDLDAEKYKDMMIELVYKTARQKMPWAKTITIQEDNATPHTSQEYVGPLKRARQKYKIALREQPAQSPDTNVLDLAVFSSMQSIVDKLTGEQRKCADTVAAAVDKAWGGLRAGTLALAFETRAVVLHAIEYHKGGNGFKIPHVGLRQELRTHLGQLNDMLDTANCLDTPNSVIKKMSSVGTVRKATSYQDKSAPQTGPSGAKKRKTTNSVKSPSSSPANRRVPTNIRPDKWKGKGKLQLSH